MIKPNYEAEQAVCGCMMMDSVKVMPLVAQIVAEDDFQVQEYKRIYGSALKLYRENKPVDAVTILPILGDEYKKVITEAASSTPTIRHCEEYARKVHERAQQIRAAEKASELLLSLENNIDVQECQVLTGDIMKCFEGRAEKNTVSAEEGFLNFCDRQDHKNAYIKTGFSLLDKYLYLERSDFVIVGGRPSAGKTAFTLQMMLAMARDYKAVYFSFETKPEKIFDRLIANYNEVSFNKVKTGGLAESELAGVMGSYDRFKALKFDIVKAAGMTVEQIRAKALQLHADIIFIDYLTLIRNSGKTLYERATNISMELHTMAQSDNMAVIALSQLNRDGKTAPDMTSLRDSGQVEQDADAVLLMDYDDSKPDKRELIIAKNKEGQIGRIPFGFDGSIQKFAPIDARYGG